MTAVLAAPTSHSVGRLAKRRQFPFDINCHPPRNLVTRATAIFWMLSGVPKPTQKENHNIFYINELRSKAMLD
jgi:hypothetical protein